jgi:hypothetical protein
VVPTVISETPPPSAANVAATTAVTATFNESVLAAPVSFALTDANGAAAAGSVSYSDATHTFTFQPSAALTGGTTYTATIGGVTDAAGQVMAAPFSWSFATAVIMTPTGLVAAYNFDEGSGTVLHDVSGKGNDGNVANAGWTTTGKFGGALSFTGTSGSWVTVGDSTSLHLTRGMTLEAWVRPASLQSPDAGWVSAISKEHRNSNNDISYALYAAAGTNTPPAGHILVRSYDYGAGGGAVLGLNTWSFLAATYDGTTLRTYVNGVRVASRTVGGSIFTTTDPLRIGGDWSGEMFTGQIDNVRIYNVALSQTQIKTDMSTAVPPGSGGGASMMSSASAGATGVSGVDTSGSQTPSPGGKANATGSAPATPQGGVSWSAAVPEGATPVTGKAVRPTPAQGWQGRQGTTLGTVAGPTSRGVRDRIRPTVFDPEAKPFS